MSKSKSDNRHLRDHNRKLNKALAKRQNLLDQGKFSDKGGRIEIIVSTDPDLRSALSIKNQREEVMQKAESLKEFLGDRSLIQKATSLTLKMALMDRETSDIYLVGHGSINSFHLEQGGKFNWQDVSRTTRHLKLEKFVQYTCGHFPLTGNNVPMGMPIVQNFDNYLAAVGKKIPDEQLNSPVADEMLVPVFSNELDLRKQINDYNTKFSGEAETKK